MNTTPNINLSTYTSDPNDKFNLLVTFNNNMTKIDTAVGAQNDAIDVIEATAGTAVSTANTASTTANTALTTANSKASIDDTVASTTTTYSSDKIDDLISGIQPGSEIDDTTTSTTKTWSSSKINTEITALTQNHLSGIENPDSTKYTNWSNYYVYSGNTMTIYGSFSFNQAPSQRFNTFLTMPEGAEFYNPNGSYCASGYITKAGDTSYLKNDVIFQATPYGSLRMGFTDNFDYTQIDSSYVFHYSFTLIKDN